MAELFCAASAVGVLHAWQMRPHWRARWRVWLAATLCVFGEALLALVLSGVLSVGCHASLGVTLSGGFWTAFIFTLLALAILRPLVLWFTRSLRPMLERVLGLHLGWGTGQRSVKQTGGQEW